MARKPAKSKKADDAPASALATMKDRDYQKDVVTLASGKKRHSRHSGDAVATAMLGAELPDLVKIVKQNKLGEKFPASRLEGATNVGLLRMALGNALRGLVRHETPVVIGVNTIDALDQKVESFSDVLEAKAAAREVVKGARKAGRRKSVGAEAAA